jgi:hypothetical protein
VPFGAEVDVAGLYAEPVPGVYEFVPGAYEFAPGVYEPVPGVYELPAGGKPLAALLPAAPRASASELAVVVEAAGPVEAEP